MRLKPVFDKWLAGFYAVLVHALFLGVLVISLDWSPEPKTDTSEPGSVQAVVVDESRVAAEITRLKEQERLQREQEAARQARLEQEAREAEMRRKQEEQRLANVQQQLEEQSQRHDAELEEQRKAEAERLSALRAQREAEAKRVAKLKEEHAALLERRAEQKKQIAEREAARQAKVEAARKLLAAEQQRREARRQQAEAERRRVEEAKRKAEAQARAAAEERRRAAERALQEQIAKEQRTLERQQRELRERHLAEYQAAIEAAVQRNWIRPAGTPQGLRCRVHVEQIPTGEVISAKVTRSCGSVALDRSVVEAVYRASPLPKPNDSSLFERELVFIFEPEV